MIDFAITTIVIILIFFGILIYFWVRLFSLGKEIKKESKEAKAVLDSSFDSLIKKIEKEIEFLDGQPGLSDEEKKLRDKLFELIKNSKETIQKEIEDVEKKF